MKSFLRPLLLGAALLGLGITNAKAAMVLLDNTSGLTDKDGVGGTNWNSNSTAYNRINGNVFDTGSTAYALESVSLLLNHGAGTAGLDDMKWRVSLYGLGDTDTAPAANASPLYQEDFSDIDLLHDEAYFTFSPSTDWLMEADSRYAIGFANDIGTSSTLWSGTSNSGIPMGSAGFTYVGAMYSLDGGSTFGSFGSKEWAFQLTTDSEPTPTPVPPTLALLALGVLAAGITRRRCRAASR